MSITLNTTVQDGLGTVNKTVVIDNADDYKAFQELVQRGSNLWPDAPAKIKAFADMVTSGEVLQEYHDIPVRNKKG